MRKWNKLDNAAKIMPATIEQSETRVFRFYCELTEDIQPEALQQAVNEAVEQFPQFLKVLRSGMFWYYLEDSDLRPVIRQETQTPCSHIYRYGHQDLLFNVTYYKKRINLEVFHALADGAGAIQLLKSILAAYINILHPGTLPLDHPLLKNTVAVEDMEVDAFSTYYTGEKNPRKMEKSLVWRFSGKRRPDLDLNVTEGVVSVKQVLDMAHTHNATMTEFLVAVFIKSIILQMTPKELERTLVIDVPINLRNYFPSETTRNFFVMMPIQYHPISREDSIDIICEAISREFARIITMENLEGRINSYGVFERLMPMRLIPLFVKDPGLRFINFVTKRFITGCVSNLGKVTLPPELECYVNQWGVYSSTLNIQAECISFKDRLTIGITEAFYDVTVIYTFFDLLKSMGIDAEIKTNTPPVILTTVSRENQVEKRYWADPAIEPVDTPDRVFPPVYSPKHLLQRVLKFVNILCLLFMAVAAAFCLISQQEYGKYIVMAINTFFIWYSIANSILYRRSILRRLFMVFIWMSIIYVVTDILTGWHQWSLTNQLPTFAVIIIIVSSLAAFLLPTDTTRSEVSLFISWEALIGLVPFILTLLGVLDFSLMPIAAGLACIVALLLLVVFRGRSLKHEYKKTFHF